MKLASQSPANLWFEYCKKEKSHKCDALFQSGGQDSNLTILPLKAEYST